MSPERLAAAAEGPAGRQRVQQTGLISGQGSAALRGAHVPQLCAARCTQLCAAEDSGAASDDVCVCCVVSGASPCKPESPAPSSVSGSKQAPVDSAAGSKEPLQTPESTVNNIVYTAPNPSTPLKNTMSELIASPLA